MSPRRLGVVVLAMALAVAARAHAGTGGWTPLGPQGGAIAYVAADPTQPVVWAATGQALFRSGDAGATWSLATGAPDTARALAVRQGFVFVGTPNHGLWRADATGAGWRLLTDGLPAGAHVHAIAVEPNAAQRLWVAADEGLFGSEDGTTFTMRAGNLGAQPFTAVSVDAGGRIYAHTLTELFTSGDGGAQWSLLRCGPHPCGEPVAHPLLADTVLSWNGTLIYSSRDGGATWEVLHGPRRSGALVPAGFQGSRLFVVARSLQSGVEHDTVLWTDDLGDSWSAAAAPPPDPSFRAFAATAAFVYLGSSGATSAGGVFRSDDGGADWQSSSVGLVGRWIDSVAVDHADPALLYVRAEDHVFASDDGGASWRLALRFSNILVFGGDELLADPRAGGRVWLASVEGLYRSDDAGHHWKRAGKLDNLMAVAVDPRTKAGAWAGGGSGLWHSTDGRRWQKVLVAPRGQFVGVEDIAVDPQDARVVWVAGYATARGGAPLGPRLYRSGDGGRSWSRRDGGLTGGFLSAVALDPARAATLFVSLDGALLRSRDAGASWEPLALPQGLGAFGLAAVTGAPTTLYAFRTNPPTVALYRSDDDGDTWQTVGDLAADGGAPVQSVTVDPASPSTVLVGTAGHGLFGRSDP